MNVEIGGLRFFNPIGLAAGFDKHADAPAGLLKYGGNARTCSTPGASGFFILRPRRIHEKTPNEILLSLLS